MTKKQYKKQCGKLFDKAKSSGLSLDFNPKNYDCKRLNCLWYGGELATVSVSDTLAIKLAVQGDVCAVLFDKQNNESACVKDKGNNGRFGECMAHFIKNDRQLNAAIKNGRLRLDCNNWIEYDGVVHSGEPDATRQFIDLGMICGNILDDNILTAIDSAIERYDEIAGEIKEAAKTYGHDKKE